MKKWKSQKCKMKKWKKSKTPKTPKCQINGTFWHFAFSEPPGPGVFQFQGVPRDRFLRPKSTCWILNGKSFSCFVHFHILANWHFHLFCDLPILWKVTFWWNWHFWGVIVIRPYGNIGESVIMCGGSPLIIATFWISVVVFCVQDVGEITQMRGDILTLVLPSVFSCYVVWYI